MCRDIGDDFAWDTSTWETSLNDWPLRERAEAARMELVTPGLSR
jgi:hypothetical protein